MQVLICKFRQDAYQLEEEIGDFIDCFFDETHDDSIENYINDLKQYKKSKMNDVDEAFFERSLIFYRHSLQNVLNF
jgi:hypothetical protein